MDNIKIKICGLKSLEDISYVNEFHPDYIGFVFANSKRRVTKELARQLKSKLDDSILATGVFVNEALENVIDLCETDIIDVVQLHGDEDISYIEILKKSIDKPIIKAIRVKDSEKAIKKDILQAIQMPFDYTLLDTYTANEYGGSGKSFDRKLIPSMEKPFFLAGGIGIDNVMDAIMECHPYGIDVSSSVETDGKKDRDKIQQLISTIRYGF